MEPRTTIMCLIGVVMMLKVWERARRNLAVGTEMIAIIVGMCSRFDC